MAKSSYFSVITIAIHPILTLVFWFANQTWSANEKMDPLMDNFYRNIAAVFVFMIGSITNSYCCSTPVFRYALEMWPTYSYIIEIEIPDHLSDKQLKALDLLKNAAASTELPLNIVIIESKVEDPQDEPMMKISFPKEHRIPGIVWQGPLTEENVHKVINSPSRKQALKQLRRGDATVWLYLESGDAVRDDKQYAILQEELKMLSNTLKLSETATDVDGNPLDIKVINTGVHFSSVRIDRNDPMEEIFIRILMRTEPDLQFFEKAPLAFPLFGQGRVLYALVGNGIKSKNIETACSTIIGWCSCTIKDDNPGTDLLFAANWDEIIGDSSWIQPEQLPDITGLAGFIEDSDIDNEQDESDDEIQIVAASKPITLSEENSSEETSESQQPEDTESELVLEPVKVNNDLIKSKDIPNKPRQRINPLLRNSLIMFSLIVVIIASTLFYLKRK